jgi:hypothetical protein
MRRSSARDRGQTEPFAAFAAVFVVALALSVWAGVFETSVPAPVDRDVAEPTADRVERALTVAGLVRPDRTGTLYGTGPAGYELNVTLTADHDRWSFGPAAPSTADVATRRVSVSDGPGSASPARLEVRVWA